MKTATPKIFGLILAGGKSTRMGEDKGLLDYHGQPQRTYLAKMALEYCDAVYFSIREDQKAELKNQPTIVDQNVYRGPFNGILSANEKYPDVAWLVLACDLPLLDNEHLELLIASRDASKMATAFATHDSKLPEPLIAIWEPDGLKKAKAHMENATSSCPRKFLINSDIKLVFPKADKVLYNANSLQEFEEAKNLIDP